MRVLVVVYLLLPSPPLSERRHAVCVSAEPLISRIDCGPH